MMNLRGEVLPVYDVRARLLLRAGAKRRSAAPRTLPKARVLLVRSDEGDAGILVDGVEGVVRLLPRSPKRLRWGGTEKPLPLGH